MKLLRILPVPIVALALAATGASAHDHGKTLQLTGKALAQCDNVTSLPGGQIVATGVVTSAQEEQSPFTQAITGGTGIYRNAHGQLTVSEAGPQPAKLTFQLS